MRNTKGDKQKWKHRRGAITAVVLFLLATRFEETHTFVFGPC